ncbi:MAG: outer membrane beta-barrel protein [Opitutaceae bacterium]|jgi:opacity protein-like surface antigen|nr:outer membrane beta-barrel protein [Opitutaceae bacterium]
MKQIAKLLALSLTALLSAAAGAAGGGAGTAPANHVRLGLIHVTPGGGSIGDLLDSGVGAAFSIGREIRFGDGTHGLEVDYVELAHVKLKGEGTPYGFHMTGSLDMTPVLASVRYSLKCGDRFSIAFGPSLGVTFAKGSTSVTPSDDDTVFTWALGATVSYAVSERVSIDAGYRHMRLSDIEYDLITITDPQADVFQLGVRFKW